MPAGAVLMGAEPLSPRGSTDIVATVGERIALTKRGQRLSGRCPFHDDRIPSLFVSVEGQRFHCFGCGAHGDAWDFLRLYEQTIVMKEGKVTP